MNEAGLIDVAGNSLLGAEDAQVDRYIEGSYLDAWKICAGVFPRTWFRNDSFLNERKVEDLAGGTGYVVLPNDFYLLSKFKMKLWQKPVFEASVQNEKTACVQFNEYTRGSTIRPVCVIDNTYVSSLNSIQQVLHYYSLPRGLATHEMEAAIYIPIPEPLKDKNDDYDLRLKEQITEPMCYLSAANVSVLLGKYDVATQLQETAIRAYPSLKSVRGTTITFKQ
jgi:hypothetical protein